MSRAQLQRRRVVTYRRLIVPLAADDIDEMIVAEACLIAADGGAIVVLVPLLVPLRLPLETPLPEEEDRAHATVERARAIAEVYGLDVRARVVRTRGVGPTIVEEATRSSADAIIMRMHRGSPLDAATEFVLSHAPCPVLIAVS